MVCLWGPVWAIAVGHFSVVLGALELDLSVFFISDIQDFPASCKNLCCVQLFTHREGIEQHTFYRIQYHIFEHLTVFLVLY